MRLLHLFFLMVLAFDAVAKDKQVEIRYSGPPQMELSDDGDLRAIDSSMLFRIVGDEVRVVIGDSWTGGVLCSDREWSCVRIPFLFNFSVGNNWRALPPSWEFDNVKYRNLGEEKIGVFGKKVAAYLICASGGSMDTQSPVRDACFSYHQKLGVLAIYLYDDGFSGENVTAYFAVSEKGIFSH